MLANKLVVVTRSIQDSGGLEAKLKKSGARIYKLPTIRIVAKPLNKKIRTAYKNIEKFDLIIFTSSNAVKFFNRNLRQLKISRSRLKRVRIVAVGPATAKRLRFFELKSKWTPEHFNAAGIVKKLGNGLRGKKIFVPRSSIAPKDLIAALKKKDAFVTEAFIYTTLPISRQDRKFCTLLKNDKVDYLTFTSPSSVFGFPLRIKDGILMKKARNLQAVCIGPSTAAAAKKAGFKKIKTPAQFTTDGMIKVLQNI